MANLIEHVNNALGLQVYWYRLIAQEAFHLSSFALVSQQGVTEAGTKDLMIYNGLLTVEIYKKNSEYVSIEQYVQQLKPSVNFTPDDCFIYEVQQVDRQSIQLGNTAWVVTRIRIKFAKII